MVYRKRGNSQWTDIPVPEHTGQRCNEIPIGPSNYGPAPFFHYVKRNRHSKHEPLRSVGPFLAQIRARNAGRLICIERHQFPHCWVGLCYYRCSLEGP
jgi:hypothetical protein